MDDDQEEVIYFHFYGGTLTTNRQPLAVSIICPLGGWSTILCWTGPLRHLRCISQCLGGSIVKISVDKSTRSRLDVSASLGLLEY